MLKRLSLGALTLGVGLLAQPAFASFHLMQIEQVIGGVNGDTSRQAIQLRMRFGGQNLVGASTVIAWDATGANPVVLANIPSSVLNGAAGDRVLLATAGFGVVTPDFVMSPIPASYLAGGKITFETDGTPGTQIWWGLAWGTYSGTNTGVTTGGGGNDADGNFNPPFAGALPSGSQVAVRFTGAASATSTNNAADYALTTASYVFTNNAGATGTLPVELIDFQIQ
ncbi:MAG: hypothetical protein ABW221_02815 [Vicinamibacteria bacterium]